MSGIDYSPDSWHMAVRARMNIGYTGPELDAAMADFTDTVVSDHESNNFDPQDWQSYVGDGNTYGMADGWDTSPGLIGEVWNNGRWDGETGTLEEIVGTALEELACEVVRVVAELLDEEE